MGGELFKNKYRIKSARLQGWDYGANAYYFVTICTHEREHYFGRVVVDNNVRAYMKLSEIGKITNQCWLNIPNHFPFAVLDEYIVMPNHFHGIIQICKHPKSMPIQNGGYGDAQNNKHPKSADIQNGSRRDVACNVSTVARPTNVRIQRASHNHPKNRITSMARPTNAHIQRASHNHPKNRTMPIARPTNVDMRHASNTERKKWMSEISPKFGSLSAIIRSFKSAITKQCNEFGYNFKWQSRFYDSIIRNEPALRGIRHYIQNNPQKWHRDRNNSQNLWM